MNNFDLVSIIIPNYNNERFIKECIESVINQTYQNIEIIVVDDESTDGSIRIINELQKEYNILLFQQKHSNAAIARNYGIKNAKGKFLLFLDSDDVLYENAIEVLVTTITKNDSDLAIGDDDIIDSNGVILKRNVGKVNIEKLKECKDVREFAFVSPAPSTKLFKKEIVDKYNIEFGDVMIAQDLNFYIKYLSCINNVSVIYDSVYKYRKNEKGMSLSINNTKMFDIVRSIDDIESFLKKNNKLDQWKKHINTLRVNHYSTQFKKIFNIDSKTLRDDVYKFFKEQVSKIDMDNCAEYLVGDIVNSKKKLIKNISNWKIMFVYRRIKRIIKSI